MLIDDVMSGVAKLVYRVPQGSVLGPLKLCLYLLRLGAILIYDSIGYHIYADDTQLFSISTSDARCEWVIRHYR